MEIYIEPNDTEIILFKENVKLKKKKMTIKLLKEGVVVDY